MGNKKSFNNRVRAMERKAIGERLADATDPRSVLRHLNDAMQNLRDAKLFTPDGSVEAVRIASIISQVGDTKDIIAKGLE